MAINNFLDSYAEYSKETSLIVPPLYNEWAGLLAISATLGRNLWITRGHFKIFPNLYIMLMGEPGTGKGLACSLLQNLLEESGYEYFAADRSSKEKFIQDLADGITFNSKQVEDIFSTRIFDTDSGGGATTEPRECFVLAEEFQDFLGQNNIDFIAFLTKLWSYSGTYRYRLKTGRSVGISDPCVNILGGSTSATFALTFPPEIAGQGFLARLILIHGEPSGVKVSFPKPPDEALKSELAAALTSIRTECRGEIGISAHTFELFDKLNQQFGGVDDPRFKDYNTRRFSQLLKLTTICCASRFSTQLAVEDIERADDILRRTERLMPRAIGSFGASRTSAVTNKILQTLYASNKPVSTKELWRLVCDDLEKYEDLGNLLSKLAVSDRIQTVNGKWLPKFPISIENKGE